MTDSAFLSQEVLISPPCLSKKQGHLRRPCGCYRSSLHDKRANRLGIRARPSTPCKSYAASESSVGPVMAVQTSPQQYKGVTLQSQSIVWLLIALQGLTLVGALVGGVLARRRRQELVDLNLKLRQINSELRKRAGGGDLVCSADDDEAMRSYRRALENSMSGASAAHPYELIGEERMSLAKARQKLSQSIREGRTALFDGNSPLAMEHADECSGLAEGIKDERASRAVTRLKASALRQMGDLKGALAQLEEALQLSQQLKDPSHDADVWGEMADTYADLGDFEKAAQAYDKCIEAIQDDRGSPQMSTWDC